MAALRFWPFHPTDSAFFWFTPTQPSWAGPGRGDAAFALRFPYAKADTINDPKPALGFVALNGVTHYAPYRVPAKPLSMRVCAFFRKNRLWSLFQLNVFTWSGNPHEY